MSFRNSIQDAVFLPFTKYKKVLGKIPAKETISSHFPHKCTANTRLCKSGQCYLSLHIGNTYKKISEIWLAEKSTLILVVFFPTTWDLRCIEAVVQRCSVKKVFLKISQNSEENTYVGVSFFNKLASLRPATLFKTETPTHVFSFKFCETFKNTFFWRTPQLG